jgi:putative FmdB family regulatory protein
MPLYEYQCDACGHRFEAIQKFSDPSLETCPKCGGAVHKLQSAPAFHLKGTGWYISDYAKPDQAKKDRATDKETDGGSKAAAPGGKDAQDVKDAAPKGDKSSPASDSAPSSSGSSSGASTGSSSSSSSSSSKDRSR